MPAYSQHRSIVKEQQSPALRRWRIDKRDKDFEEYNEIKKAIGRQNAPKTFDKFLEIKYNKNNQAEFGLLRHYKASVEKGEIAAISGFQNYKNQYNEIGKRICVKSFGGVEIKTISYHFLDRTIDSIYYTYTKDGKPIKHEGVSVERSLKVLSEGTARSIVYDSKGRPSQKYILKGVGDVTINPMTGELVQVNKDE